MKKELSIRQLFIDSLGFIGSNFVVLCCLALLSFSGSYAALSFGAYQNPLSLLGYGIYIYLFYFFFVSIYYEQRPLLTKEKFVDSLIKLVSIFALSMFILICGKIGLNVLHHLSKGLLAFPDFYASLRRLYIFMVTAPSAKIIIYLGIITLLTFSFFIPGFSWISTINGKDSSVVSAYLKIRGNYLKTICVFISIYGVLPLLIGFIGIMTSHLTLSILYAAQTVFQIVVYLHLYDTFYKESQKPLNHSAP